MKIGAQSRQARQEEPSIRRHVDENCGGCVARREQIASALSSFASLRLCAHQGFGGQTRLDLSTGKTPHPTLVSRSVDFFGSI